MVPVELGIFLMVVVITVVVITVVVVVVVVVVVTKLNGVELGTILHELVGHWKVTLAEEIYRQIDRKSLATMAGHGLTRYWQS